jgi:hypothetical protein
MEKDNFFTFLMFDVGCQWRQPAPMKRGRWELGKIKNQIVEKSGNFFPVYFVKILLIQKRRWKYETFVSKS